MYLEEIRINAGNWVDSAQDRNYWRAIVNRRDSYADTVPHNVSTAQDERHLVLMAVTDHAALSIMSNRHWSTATND